MDGDCSYFDFGKKVQTPVTYTAKRGNNQLFRGSTVTIEASLDLEKDQSWRV